MTSLHLCFLFQSAMRALSMDQLIGKCVKRFSIIKLENPVIPIIICLTTWLDCKPVTSICKHSMIWCYILWYRSQQVPLITSLRRCLSNSLHQQVIFYIISSSIILISDIWLFSDGWVGNVTEGTPESSLQCPYQELSPTPHQDLQCQQGSLHVLTRR